MKKITIKKIKEELQVLGADASTTELVVNNVLLYNDLVENYENGIKTNMYLTYQLNVQITKQLSEIRKTNKIVSGDTTDSFSETVDDLKIDLDVK